MSLYVVATPIGNYDDLSKRARHVLSECTTVIGEEAKETRRLLKALGLELKPIESLNEHSRSRDLLELVELCRTQMVALVSDCGTPGFCDPGADLVAACRKAKVDVLSVPGPASITTFLSIAGRRLDQFFFRGFLPANTEERRLTLQALRKDPWPTIVMDTPYRLGRLLADIAETMPQHQISLGMDLSTPEETFMKGTAAQVLAQVGERKAEFILLIEPQGLTSTSRERKNSR